MEFMFTVAECMFADGERMFRNGEHTFPIGKHKRNRDKTLSLMPMRIFIQGGDDKGSGVAVLIVWQIVKSRQTLLKRKYRFVEFATCVVSPVRRNHFQSSPESGMLDVRVRWEARCVL